MTGFRTDRCTIRGHETVTREGGTGPTLLHLHGVGGASGPLPGDEVSPFLASLARSFQVVLPEHPGYGQSERPVWLDSIQDLAYFYLDYLEARDLTDVHVVGSSLGGWIAMELAIRNTSRIATLTLCGAAGIHVKGVPKGDIFLWSKEEIAENCLRNPDARATLLGCEPTPEEEFLLLKNWQTSALLAWQPRFHNPDLYKWLHRIDVPTHVVWAEHDQVFPLPYADALVELIGGARLSVIPDCGHFMEVDRPEEIAGAVRDFIKGEAA